MIHRKLQPSGDHILIQYADARRVGNRETNALRQTKLPSAARVIAIGPGREGEDGNMIPLGLKVGERIFVDRTCGVKIRLKRQSYAVIRKRDLIPNDSGLWR
jgi:chaperonin GroES